MRSRTDITEALLLRSVDYGDADRVVTLLTRGFGKGAFIARAARRSKRRFGGALEPFSLLRVELRHEKGPLGGLGRAEVTRAFPRIVSDLARMSAGFAGLELVRELSADHEPDAAVFATTLAFLGALDATDIAPERLFLCFETRLLSLAGYAPGFDQCGLCGKQPRPKQAGLFDERQGHLVCSACGGAPHRLGAFVRAALMQATGQNWLSAAEPTWPKRELAEARTALRAFAEQRIGHALSAAALVPMAESRS